MTKNIPINDANIDKDQKDENFNIGEEDSVSVDLSPEALEALKKEGVIAEEKVKEETSIIEEKLDPLEAEKKKAAEYYDSLLRLKAEFENYKKRMEKERIKFLAYAKESILLKFLPTLDNLERSLKVEGEDKHTLKKIVEGIELISNELKARLKEEGVERMETIGKKFDPYTQEALAAIPSPQHDNDTVIEEVTPGYTLNSAVIRPAKVIVAKNDTEKKIIV